MPSGVDRVAELDVIAIVGGSLAGLRSAEALRRRGYAGRIVFVGEEPERPYDRPPLSKEVLAGKREPEQIALSKPEKFDALELDLRLGRRADSLDLDDRIVVLADGEQLRFDGLIIATGASARALPGAPTLPGIHTLRRLNDCLALRRELETSPRVVVVGAGFIGAEVAATCRGRGLDVTLVEALPLPLANALPQAIGAVCAEVHRDAGVDLRCGVGVDEIFGGDRVEGIRLADGACIPADVVVIGIGVAPNTGWLESSGLALDNGVVCDASLATAAPGVVAAGDVARWHHPLFDESTRVEHWTNAVEQADAAAARLLAGPDGAEPFAAVPFVWSDQYDRKFQSAGRFAPDDEMRVFHGSLEERRFVALFRRGDRLSGALAVNRGRQLIGYRRMIAERVAWKDAIAQAESADAGG
ncbi:MAG: FAD-dependent oxidoreductase [Deltaproteobacteria bacterium]|nr:FAD-dependent oxidoreductase [Deltaproteobacteria bacterium]